MPADLQELLARFSRNAPAEDIALQQFEETSKFALPGSYRAFLRVANGGRGFIGKDRYVILWRLEELLSLNETYEVQQYAPGLFLFGSDGGGEAYAFDMRSPTKPIVSLPFVGMAIKAVCPICSDFEVFLKGEFQIRLQ